MKYINLIMGIIMFIMVLNIAYALYPYDQRFRPLLAGIQIDGEGLGDICSIGFMGYWVENIGGIGQLYHWGVISAEHCYSINENVYQNVSGLGNLIGSVSIEESLSDSLFIHVETTLGWNPPTNIISNEIITPDGLYGNDYIAGYLLFDQVNPGDPVTKVGRTTGHTSGVVRYKFESYYGFEYVILTDYVRARGDSGGFVGILADSNRPPDYPKPYYLVGIHHGTFPYRGNIYSAFMSYSGIRNMNGYTILVYKG